MTELFFSVYIAHYSTLGHFFIYIYWFFFSSSESVKIFYLHLLSTYLLTKVSNLIVARDIGYACYWFEIVNTTRVNIKISFVVLQCSVAVWEFVLTGTKLLEGNFENIRKRGRVFWWKLFISVFLFVLGIFKFNLIAHLVHFVIIKKL